MAGQIAGFLWTVAALFFLFCVFVLPVVFAYWRAREKADAARTREVLDGLLHDHSHAYEQDAL